MLKYYNYDIVFQEIPDEVTLAINLTCCPLRCEGCHSPHLREDIGIELTHNEIDKIIAPYSGMISCVCLMGGDNDIKAVEGIAAYIKKHYGLKFGWYSGREIFPSMLKHFDYVKLGRYDSKRGGLKDKNTNQKLYLIKNEEITNIKLI